MPKFEDFPTKEDLAAKHESKRMPGSNDVSMSTYVGGVEINVGRPGDNEMYGISLNGEEVAMIGGSTAYAEKVFDGAKKILQSGVGLEEAKRQIGALITEINGGALEK